MKSMTTIFAAAALAIGLSAQAWAQEDVNTDEITDEQIEQFADVQSDIREITQEYSSRLQEVEDPDAAAQLQQEASQLMVEAVEDIGLDVETYNNIAVALESDEDLRNRVESQMN